MDKKIIPYILLAVILVSGYYFRLYKIENPIADWHSWRQADTASVARYYLKHGINLFVPRYDDVSALASGKQNPKGYRMVEFPLYNALHTLLAQARPTISFDQNGRLLTVYISLLSIVFIFFLVRKLVDTPTALLSSTLLALIPYNVFYSRVVLPDQLMIMFWLAGTWMFFCGQDGKRRYHWLSAILFALGILTRPYLVFFLPPLILVMWQKDHKVYLKPSFWIYLLIVFVPFILWRSWIKQFAEGIPVSGYLLNPGGIRFRPAWFRWIFAERIGKLILGYWGLIPLALGIITKVPKREKWLFHWWLVGALVYFAIFAGGNVTHDYYQVIIVPILVVFVAKGIMTAFRPNNLLIWPITPFITTLAVLMMLTMGWYQVKEYYNVNNWNMVHAGIKANEILPADAVVVAPYQGDTAFLYQINRPGWPYIEGDIKTMVDMKKVTHYISTSYDDVTNKIMGEGEFKILEKNNEYVIVQLRYPQNP